MNHEGEFFRLSGFRLLIKPVQGRIPIYLATFRPRALELTGEIADGWLPTHVSLRLLPGMLERVSAGAKLGCRALSDIDLAMVTLAAVTPPAHEARQLCAEHLAYYVGGMGTFYHELSNSGFGDEADRIQERWNEHEGAHERGTLAGEGGGDVPAERRSDQIRAREAHCRHELDEERGVAGDTVGELATLVGEPVPGQVEGVSVVAVRRERLQVEPPAVRAGAQAVDEDHCAGPRAGFEHARPRCPHTERIGDHGRGPRPLSRSR